ncbi:hypothetical protein ACFLU5_04900 [Bacteroidota bacterium]
MKPTIIKAFTTILFLFSWTWSMSAGDYRVGYIVTNEGDTIHGFIDYEDWEVNPRSVIFTLRLGPIGKTFNIEDLAAFGVMNNIYRRNIVEIDQNPYQKKNLTPSKELRMITDTVFLQVLVDGEKQLYFLGDENRKKHYFIGPEEEIETLINQLYLEVKSGDSHVVSNPLYREQLIAYFQDCPSVLDVIQLVEYTTEDLINLFKFFSTCSESRIEYSLKITGAKLEWDLILGVVSTNFNVIGDNIAYQSLVISEFSQSTNMAIGLGCNILFPMKGFSQISMNNEILFNSYLVSSYRRDPEVGDQYTSRYYEIGFSYLNLNMMLRYYYPIKSFNVFVNGGFSFGYALSVINFTERIQHYATTTITVSEAIKKPNDYEYGFLLGLGGDYGKFSVELRYEKRNGIMTQADVAAITSRYYAIVGYKFGKSKRRKF